jgi:flagellar motor switch protein FliN/FliY
MMSEANAAKKPEDAHETQPLDRAIEELRGALNESAPAEAAGAEMNSAIIMNIPVEVQIVLGSAELPVSKLMELGKGSTVALNRRIGEAVDVVVNGRRIARGEIIVMENDTSRFGVRLTEIISATAGR